MHGSVCFLQVLYHLFEEFTHAGEVTAGDVFSECGVFLRGGSRRRAGGCCVRSAGGFHVTLHGAHACDRAPVRLPLQLHGLPVGRGLPPVRHHGVSHRRLPVLGVTHYK